jgi:protein-export membrane protein SecD
MAQKTPVTRGESREQVRNKFIAIVALSIICLVVIAPKQINRGINAINQSTNIGIPTLSESGFNLGLDLQGGAHLIYQAKTDTIPDGDRASSVEGVRDVIERRVRGGLGVAEPIVQTTRVGNDYRIIVELPGVTDVNQAITMIGQTPILEFKEANTEPARDLTPAEKKQMDTFNAGVLKKANEALATLRRGGKFEDAVAKYSDDATTSTGGDMGFISQASYPEFFTWAKTRRVGEVGRDLVKTASGYNILKKVAERDGEKQVTASHLLICYTGATRCDNPIYSKEQALAKINELKKQATIQNFATLVKQNSTEPGAADRAGDLGTFTKDTMVPAFTSAIWDAKAGTIIGPVETEFGYHLIYKKAEETPKQYHLARVFLKTQDKTDILPPQEPWKTTGLSGKQLKRAEVTQDKMTGQVQVSLQFDDEGTKLFADVTTRNSGKEVAIFLDNEAISIPRVNEPITSGSAVINGNFTLNEARVLSQRLNSGALPVPVELLSQQKVDATLGEDSLAKSFKAGVAGLLLVMLFMIAYYRLPGLLSVFSLAVYALVTLALFRVLGVTLTLAGIAGFILSIGMAVDANVLVFERLKEELQNGRSLKSAMEESFARAWPSIRDGHVTTLISSIVLMWFGGGFIQGFAVVLATGVLMSLFSAITVTRTVMRLVFGRFDDKANALFLGYTKRS